MVGACRRLLWIAVVVFVPMACAYSTKSLLPGGVRTVAVDIFDNATFYREIEFRLARELTEELRHRTHYRVARRRSSDAVLTGSILSVRRPTLVETEDDLVSEQRVIVTARVRLESSASGAPIAEFVISNAAEFIVERGESLETAFAEALRDLAEDIVNRLEAQSFHEDLAERRRASESGE